MTLLEKIEMMERVDGLIRRKATGTPRELASRLNISKRGLFKTLKLMKEMGGPIYYCISSRSYVYEYKVDFAIGFRDASRFSQRIVGGFQKIFLTAQNVHCDKLPCSKVHIMGNSPNP